MDESHAPIGSPAPEYYAYFVGWLSAQLQREHVITPQDWAQALVATDAFQREQKIAEQEQSGL